MRLFPVEDGKFPAISGDCLWQFKMNVNLIVLQPKNPRGLIRGFVIIFTAKGSNHSPCLHLMNWIMSNGRISHFPWQTHRTVSAPFTESNSRSALFNIFRAVALAERQGRGGKKTHCCYGDEERVSGGWGAPWQKTRPDPTTPAPIGPELNADVFWQHGVLETTLKRTRDSYLKLFTLILSGSTQCPLHQLEAARVYTFRHFRRRVQVQGDMTACAKVTVKTASADLPYGPQRSPLHWRITSWNHGAH